MWVQPMILAPLSGLSFSARLLRAIRPGISKTNETKLTQLKYDKICLLNSFRTNLKNNQTLPVMFAALWIPKIWYIEMNIFKVFLDLYHTSFVQLLDELKIHIPVKIWCVNRVMHVHILVHFVNVWLYAYGKLKPNLDFIQDFVTAKWNTEHLNFSVN